MNEIIEQNGYTRRMSLEEKFMHYSTDDLLFGSMVHFSTYDPKTEQLYLSKKNYGKYRKEIATLCDTTVKTLSNHLKLLIKNGFVEDTSIIGEHGGGIPCYTFPYHDKEKYQIVNNEILWCVIKTRNKYGVKIYTYLLNKYLWKQKENDKYVFTNRELMRMMGYTCTENHVASNIITEILKSFCREGIMNISRFYETVCDENGKPVPSPRMLLEFVAEQVEQLDPVNI